MSATYDIRTAALAVGANTKWADNIISHHSPNGVTHASRGVERSITFDAILILAVARMIIAELGTTRGAAVRLAEKLVAGGTGQVVTPGGVEIRIDLAAVTQAVRRRLLESVESTSRPRRGRPPSRHRLDTSDF
ncbi:MAG TPA: hypothetical protein VG818_10080 [Gemmatimonadaceae bacterium]|jgi:hypothetical protein|nr:hypothetical protein [Gemmatimonadaceae bacterium]